MSFFNTQKAFLGKMLLIIVSFAIMAASVPVIKTYAVSYAGSGTKKDPFLVTTAEQLNGMRNNLSAHYKLAATIDMRSFGTLEPIGFLAKPFTGSFTCDIANDGLPYYAIKNLTVNNKRGLINKHAHATGNFPDYVENNSHWEAALFGATDGATFNGIFVLNASVTNSCVGELSHTYPGGDRSKPYVVCPGVDENATGVLIAIAKQTVIQGCMASGKIDTKSNHTGGIVGRMQDSTIINSYANVDVASTGCWAAGGLVGSVNDSTIQYCFATGNVNAPMKKSFENVYLALAGGLFGSVTGASIVSDCYSTGKISSNGCAFTELNEEKLSIFSNCYTVATIDGITALPTEKKNPNNCYVLASAGCKQPLFSAASANEINAAFANVKGWVTGKDKYPTLSAVTVLRDENIYVAGSDRAGVTPPAQKPTASGTSSVTQNSDVPSGDSTITENTPSGSNSEIKQEENSTQTVSSANGEKQVLMIVLAAIIVAISALTSVVLISILKKSKSEKCE